MVAYRIQPGQTVRLTEWDPRATGDFSGTKQDGKEALKPVVARLGELQEVLYAQGQHALLILIQGMDTAGKDGAIKHVFAATNPQGLRVATFGVPTELEYRYDFLRRVHRQTPAKGEIAIFNRSHYEDIVAVRVRELAPESIWRRRFDHINAFEQMLADEGTTILKFFLHISPEEQKERLEARLADPTKHWKFHKGDLDDRKLWAEYQQAYEEVLERSSTEHAPWYLIPADRKWYRNLIMSQIIVARLESLDLRFPEAEEGLEDIIVV
jgi:PPK2 family polyphosphate:nucleotide phosphotransferase